MRLRAFARLSRSGGRLIWGGALLALLAAAGTTAIGDVTEEAKRSQQERDDSFALFAGPTAVLTGNQLQCGLVNQGEVCKDVFDSPTGNGGFWPTGSSNGYIFNTGLQIAGIIGENGGPWANDTVAGYFFDARGNQRSGTPLGNIYVSTDADDAAEWETIYDGRAMVEDTDLFAPILTEREDNRFASQEDSYVEYWEGDPVRITNRQHPMGIGVSQRSLAWNYPAGNESVLYFIYKFTNVSDDEEFKTLNNNQFFGGDRRLPEDGYTLNELFAAFSTDMDVTVNAGENFSTAILPFDIGLSYHGGFNAPDFIYPPDLFFPPFFTNAPGLIGVKYLRSPINPATGQEVGLTLFSNTQNPSSPGAQFIDPLGDKQLWRYLSGRLSPAQGDPPCNVDATIVTGDPRTTERPLCFIFQQAADTRFFQSSGPFSIEAGDEGTIVVAYIAAATVNVPEITPQSSPNTNPPGVPSFHPTFPSERSCDADGLNCEVSDNVNAVLPIEKAAGWIDYIDRGAESPGSIELGINKVSQFNIAVVPGSLLGKALVAQTIFDNQFLLGFAPDPPPFELIPGDGKVTVIWTESPTEDREGPGDPFYEVASDTLSPLYNPNYRQYDVEGYRIWRGRDPGTLNLMAQFDKAASVFTDNTCETVPPDFDWSTIQVTRPVGYAAGEECPYASSPHDVTINSSMIFNNGSDGGPPGGGVVRAAGGAAVPVNLTNVIIDDAAGETRPANDTGIPFAWVDDDVANNFTYWYSVSAFDVNSQASGPHSLRSLRPAESVVPRVFSTNVDQPFSFSVAVQGDDGVPLDPSPATVQPDAATGIFSGPQPPTNAAEVFTIPDPSAAGPLLAPGTVTITIDSIIPLADRDNPCPTGANGRGMCWRMWTTADNGIDEPVVSAVDGTTPVDIEFFGDVIYSGPVGGTVLPFSDEELARYDIEAGFGNGVTVGVRATWIAGFANSAGEALQCRFDLYGDGCEPGGSRWFDGTTETLEHPTVFTQAGAVADADTIFHPISHTDVGDGSIAPASGDMVCFPYTMSFMGRAADVQFTWEGGTIASARDITHNVEVPFAPRSRASWGFLNEDANGNGLIDWQDFDYIDGMAQNTSVGGFLDFFCALGDRDLTVTDPAEFAATPQFQAISTEMIQPESMTQTGTGFGLYVNGEHYIFGMSSAPPDGTVWTLRTYLGYMEASDPFTSTPSNYTLLHPEEEGGDTRPVMITNLSYVVDITEAGTVLSGTPDLSKVHTVPDPYLSTSQYDLSPTSKEIQFVNLPPEATIRIYTLTGVLVDIVEHPEDDASLTGRATWDVRNRNNQFVASGVYFFHVQTPEGDEYVGKFTVVNFAGQN